MADISSTFKSILKQKYSSIQDTSVNHGNAQILADHNVENIDLSLTSPPSNNTLSFDAKIADLISGKESFVSFQDLTKKELVNIDSIINKAADLINRYESLSFQAKGGYGASMQYAQGELKQAEIDLDNFIKANSSYDSYQDLLNTQKELEDIDKSCTEMISYYDRQIKWQEYYKKYDSEECRNFSIEGMLGEKEYHDNISGSTFRGEEYTKLLEIQTIGDYDEKLKELFGDDYEKQFASYGLDFKFDYLKMYNYIYQTEGEAAAKEFYAFAEDNINSMAGLVGALSAVKDLKTNAEIMDAATNYLQVHAKGMGDGVVGSLEGVVAWFSNNKSRSASSYETMWYSMMLETGKYGKGQIFNYQVGQGTGQMLPVMLIGCVCPESLMIGGLPVVKAATSGYLLMSSGGRDYKEQMINGKTREEAIIHGLLAGTTEVTTEHLLGGLPFLSDSNVYNLRTFFTAMGKEGTQEVIQDMISEFLLGEGIPTFNSEAERDAYWEQWSKEKLMTFAVAAFSAGELQGGSLAMSTSNINYINKQIELGTVTEQELVDLIKEQYPIETKDLSNQQILGEYNGQISKYVELKLEALLKISAEKSPTHDESMADNTILKGHAKNIADGLNAALTNIMNSRNISKLDALNYLNIIIQYRDYNILYNNTYQNMTQYSFRAIEDIYQSLLKNYNNELANKIEISVNAMMEKGYSEQKAINIIKGYANGKYDINYITKINNARSIINSLEVNEIELGLENYNNLKKNIDNINNIISLMKYRNPNLSTQDCLMKIDSYLQLKDSRIFSRDVWNIIKRIDLSSLSEALGRIQFKSLEENLARLSITEYNIIRDLHNSLITNPSNDYKIVKTICNGLANQMLEGNNDARQIANRITEIVNNVRLITYESIDYTSCHWSEYDSAVRVGRYSAESNEFSTVMHETGHMHFTLILNETLPTNFTKVITEAQKRVTAFNDRYSQYNNYINKTGTEINNRAKVLFQQYLKDAGMTELEYRQLLYNKYSMSKNPIQELKSYMEKRGKILPQSVIDALNKSFSVNSMVQEHINEDLREIENRLVRTQYPAYSAVSDIMDAVFLGKSIDLNGKFIDKSYGHFEKYYSSLSAGEENLYSFHEMIANYYTLKACNSIEGIELIRNTFGQELYDMLESTYQKIVYGNLPNMNNSNSRNYYPSNEYEISSKLEVHSLDEYLTELNNSNQDNHN